MTGSATGRKRAAIYLRVSSAGQEDNWSLATQEQSCRAYAESKGWGVAAVYRDVHTGSEVFERPGLSQLRAEMRAGAFDVLLVHALDRLSRDQNHQGLVLSEAEHAGVLWDSATEEIDDSPTGKILRAVIGGMAELERLKIAERTVRGRIARVHGGKLIPGGRPPYGYRWRDETKGQLDEDPTTAPVVRRIFAAIAGGTSLTKLSGDLMHDQIPTPSGKGVWHASTLAHILHSPRYRGEAYGWGIRKAGVTPQTFDPEKAIRLPEGTIPTLIDPQTWDDVQVVLRRNKAQSVRSAKHPEAALLRGGFVRCGTCGRAMKVRPRSDGGVDYYCRPARGLPCPSPTAIKGSLLDPAVWARARAIITNPETVTRELDRLRESDPTAEDARAVARFLAGIERQRGNLSRAIALLDDPDAAAPLVLQLRELAERDRALRAEQAMLEERRAAWQSAQADLDSLTRWCTTVAGRVDSLSWEQRRSALTALNFGVAVYPRDHNPRFVVTADIDTVSVSNTT